MLTLVSWFFTDPLNHLIEYPTLIFVAFVVSALGLLIGCIRMFGKERDD